MDFNTNENYDWYELHDKMLSALPQIAGISIRISYSVTELDGLRRKEMKA